MGERIETGASELTLIAFASDGATLATGSESGALLLWDVQTRECKQTRQANDPRGCVRLIVFSSNGLYVAAAVDSFIMVWELNTGCQQQTFVGHDTKVSMIAFASNNRQVQSVSSDGSVKLWDIATSSCLRTICIPLWVWANVAFSSDLTKIASTQECAPIQLWDVTTGCLLGTLEQDDEVDSLAFSPDDTMLVSASGHRGIIKLWDLTNNMEPNLTPLGRNQNVLSMAFSSDGAQLAVVSFSGLHIWDAKTGQYLRMLGGWKASWSKSFWSGASVTFGNDGILLAMVSEGSRDVAEIWNMSTEICLQSLADKRISEIIGLEFSPDSATIAIVTNDTVSLWDVANSSCIVVYASRIPYRSKGKVKFSDTGSHLYYYNRKDGENAIRWEGQTATAHMGIDVAPLEPLHIPGYSIQERDAWIKKDGEYIVWIPPDYRPFTYATWGSMMALGYESGRVAFLRFHVDD